MSGDKKAQQMRKRVIDAVKGRTKEVVGAVIGDDSLVAEGQLDQTQAKKRREANAMEAAADSAAAQANVQAARARMSSLEQRTDLDAEATAMKGSVRKDQAAAKHTAERSARQDAARAETEAELRAQDKVRHAKAAEREEISDAQAELADSAAAHQTSMQAAANAHAEADRIRRKADDLADEADLPRAPE